MPLPLGKLFVVCPLLVPALALAISIAGVDLGSWGCFFIAGLLLCLLAKRRWKLAVIGTCISLVGAWSHWDQLDRQDSIREFSGSHISSQMTVVKVERYDHLQLEFSGARWRGSRVMARLPEGDALYKVGDVLDISGVLRSPRVAMNPEVLDESNWLHRRGIGMRLSVQEVSQSGSISFSYRIQRLAENVHQWIRERLVMGLDPQSDEAKVIKAMFLGERPVDAAGLVEDFRHSGTIHVFAVSGLHVMMVGSFFALLLKLSGVGRRVWIPLVICLMFFYALVTGMRPPAMRASVMGAVFLLGGLLRRKPELANSVAVGFIVALLWNGHMLFHAGFQLSFAVLTAIVLLASWCGKVLRGVSYMDPFLPRSLYSGLQELNLSVRRKIQGALSISTSAWCGSSPFLLWHFGVLAPISIIASLPLVFLVFVILAVASISLVLGSLNESVATGMNRWNAGQARLARVLASHFASVPGGHSRQQPWQRGERVVVFSLAEGGGATYIGVGGGVLLDAAASWSFKRSVAPSLIKKGARIDSLVISHADSAHCGGVNQLLGLYSIKQALLPEASAGSRVYQQSQCDLLSQGVGCIYPRSGERFRLTDSSVLEVVSAPHRGGGHADDRVMVLRLHWRGKKVLFVNDAGFSFEQWALENDVDVTADVLVLGLHSSDISASMSFIHRVSPEVIITSEERNPEDKDQSLEWERGVREQGIYLYDQSNCGAVTMEWDNERGISLRSFVGDNEDFYIGH